MNFEDFYYKIEINKNDLVKGKKSIYYTQVERKNPQLCIEFFKYITQSIQKLDDNRICAI